MTRRSPDPGDFAMIDLKNRPPFNPKLVALISEESQSGAGLIVVDPPAILKKGQVIVVQVGRLSPLPAVVRWLRKLEDRVYRIGIEYLE
jgi:hypothetical protein